MKVTHRSTVLTAVPLVLSPGAVDAAVTEVRLRDAALVAAVQVCAVLAHAAVELVGAVRTVHVSVATPVVRDTAPHVALEPARANCEQRINDVSWR